MGLLHWPGQARANGEAPPGRGRWQRKFLWLLLLGGLALAGAAGARYWEENFHEVLPGLAYRSGQLSAPALAAHIERDHIRSVVNLRGPNPQADWYRQEVAVAQQMGIAFYDLPVESEEPPRPEEVEGAIAVLESCPKPVLVHCNSGIDRAGLLAAFCILVLDEQGSPAKAAQQFPIRYGHLPWSRSHRRTQTFLQAYQGWLDHNGYPHTPQRFHKWGYDCYLGVLAQWPR